MQQRWLVFKIWLPVWWAVAGLLFSCQVYNVEEILPQPPKAGPKVTYLFWTNIKPAGIMRATLHDTNVVKIDTLYTGKNGVKSPHGLAADATRKKIYWTEYASSRLIRADWSGQGAPEIIYDSQDSLHGPVGLTINTRQQQIYWTEPGHNRIKAAPADGTDQPRILYNAPQGVDGAFGIALAGNFIYWTEPADNQVLRAPVNGQGWPSIIYSHMHGLTKPFGITVDTATSKIYVLDNPLPYVTEPDLKDQLFGGSINGGSPFKPLFQTNNSIQNAYSLAIDYRQSKLYWLNQSDPSTIMQGNLNGSGTPREYIHLNGIGFALTVAYPIP